MGNVGLSGRAVEQAAAVDALTGELARLIDRMKAVNAHAGVEIRADSELGGVKEACEVRLDTYLAAVRSKVSRPLTIEKLLETVMTAKAGVIGVDLGP